MSESTTIPVAWVKLYLPSGLEVRASIPFKGDWVDLMLDIEGAMTAGFLINAPGLEEGEQKDEIGSVVRFQKFNDRDNSTTESVDLYLADDRASKYKTLTVYLNNADAIDAFEKSSGLRINNMKPYEGTGHVERGNRKTDQFIYPAPRSFVVVSKHNPKHDPNETDLAKKKPKRLFVRWESSKTAAMPAKSPDAGEPEYPVAAWERFLDGQPTDIELNDMLRTDYLTIDRSYKNTVDEMIKKYADTNGFKYDREKKKFLPRSAR